MELLIGKRQKFNVVCDEWLEYKKMRIKESTYANYKLKITNYLKKDFGERNLKEIANINLNRYVEELQFKLSSKTVKDIITVLKSILKYAERKYNMDFKLDKHQAVTDTKLEELTREVREHNNFAKRVPVLEENMKYVNQRLEILERRKA